jgi:phosphoserine phosphatase RsbU/P
MKLVSAGESGLRARRRPPARHIAIPAAVLWLVLFGGLYVRTRMTVLSLFGIAPLIVAAVADERRTAIFAGTAAALAAGIGRWEGSATDGVYWTKVAVVCATGAVAVLVAGVGRRREERLARMTAIAEASQLALLPPLPPEMTGIGIAARYRSSTGEASVGGDLYEIIPTGHSIRVIIGDVRGKGLDAILLARHVLSAFRRSAVAVPAIEQVACEVNGAIRPHLGEEDFVTAVLAEFASCGELTIVNCGHHPPLLVHDGGLQPLVGETTALPLGLEDDFTAFTASWVPGDRLLLYTDGLVESRDQYGEFLAEDQIAAALAATGCEQALDMLMTAVHRHTGGHGHDDIALLLLEHGAASRSSAVGHPAGAAVETLGTRGEPARSR